MAEPPLPGPRLRIIAVNDVYTLENLPRLRTLVEHCRTTNPADVFLVTLAGDFLSPSVLSSVDAGRGMVACFREIGVTHVIFGNHEDDVGIAELRQRVGELGATWLSTNVGFEPPLPTHDVLTVGRVRVGLVGAVVTDATMYRHPPFGGGASSAVNGAVLAEASRLLTELGCSSVIPLTHQSLEDDRALVRAQRTPPFPVVIGGHDHLVSMEQLLGSWLVKAGSDAVHALVIDLTWSPEAPLSAPDVPDVHVRLEDVANFPEDVALRDRVDMLNVQLRALEEATLVVLEPNVTLSSVASRSRQTSLGCMLCTVLRDALGADACVFNGGGIRGDRTYVERFTYADLKREIAFDNEVVIVALPGAVLRAAVAASRARAAYGEWGGYLQVDSGMTVDEHDVVTEIRGLALDPSATYRVAMVRELLMGLDHIDPLVDWATAHPASVPPADSGREGKQVLLQAFAFALWRAMGGFDAVDGNHDGVVSEAEVFAAESRVEGLRASPLTAALVIHALDVDGDGVVSRSEAFAPRSPRS